MLFFKCFCMIYKKVMLIKNWSISFLCVWRFNDFFNIIFIKLFIKFIRLNVIVVISGVLIVGYFL